jgi:hypothetical protein
MESKQSDSTLGFWKKVALVLFALFIVNLSIAFLFHLRFGDMLFVEGILVFASGAYIAAGMGNPRRERWQTLTVDPEGYREYLESQRSKQFSEGTILMIIGAIIIGLGIAISLFIGWSF